MSTEKFEWYVGKADEMADLARKSYSTMRGSERGPMVAALAGMYAQLAALEVVLLTDDRRAAKEQRVENRLKALERHAGIGSRRDRDPVDEVAV